MSNNSRKKVVITQPLLYARNFDKFKKKFFVVEMEPNSDMKPHVHDAHAVLVKMHEQFTKNY